MKNNFAFLSYSRQDVKVALDLWKKTEKYPYPKQLVDVENRPEDRYRVRPIFLDVADLSTKERNFSKELQENLANTRYLVVICSPNSAKSDFVKKEIDFFLESHNNDNSLIIPVYVDHVFSGMHPVIDQILATRNCPIYVTVGGEAGHAGRKYCFYHLMEFLLKVDFDKLYNRYEAYAKRKRRFRTSIITIFLTILISTLSFGWYKQIQATKVEHDLAQFEKETFPFSLVVGYTENFLMPSLQALKDSLKQEPHIIVMMPRTYPLLNEEIRKKSFQETKAKMSTHFGFSGFVTEELHIKSRRRAASIVRIQLDSLKTPVYYDLASTVKAIKSVVDYKYDGSRHQVQIDTTKVSRDEMVREYSLQFIRQTKEQLAEDSTLVHFVFSPQEMMEALARIKK